MKLKVKGDFFEVEVEGETVQDVWRKAAFWHSLPTICPVDDKPVRLGFANRGGFDYYYLESTGPKRYRFPFGQSTAEKGGLFPGEYDKKDGETYRRWIYWDGQQEIVMWENGRMLAAELPQTNGTPPQQAPTPAPQPTPDALPPRRTAMNISGATCPECHAPAGKPHTTKCSKHNG